MLQPLHGWTLRNLSIRIERRPQQYNCGPLCLRSRTSGLMSVRLFSENHGRMIAIFRRHVCRRKYGKHFLCTYMLTHMQGCKLSHQCNRFSAAGPWLFASRYGRSAHTVGVCCSTFSQKLSFSDSACQQTSAACVWLTILWF